MNKNVKKHHFLHKNELYTKKAFTLTEMLAVIGIMIVLAGIMLGAYKITMSKAKDSATKSMFEQLKIGLENYKTEMGYYPPQPVGGNFLIGEPVDGAKEFTDYIDWYELRQKEFIYYVESAQESNFGELVIRDAYETPIWYRCPGYHNRNSYDIESAGADSLFGYLPLQSNSYGKSPTDNTILRDRNYSYEANQTHATVNWPDWAGDNIKNWE